MERVWSALLVSVLVLSAALGAQGVAAQEITASELTVEQLDARIAALEAERAKLRKDKPITVAVAGYTLGALGMAATVATVFAVMQYGTEREGLVLGVPCMATAVMLGIGIGGTVWHVRRKRARRRIDASLGELRAQRQQVLQVAPQLGPTSYGVRLSVPL